ncbi:hypothetical protein [Paracidovorax wautersii]|uniref:Uncharacterized protein n=1 Tax=Paracidovorax wautersii TaxID=1177982 RepID=A0A1I2E6R3_9BURK|nr:hypothetical protein [Paracidovorax wautersii]SFE88407.1 hypothetical protein SAMN04489711_106257 [Paracidovorax wautersii]
MTTAPTLQPAAAIQRLLQLIPCLNANSTTLGLAVTELQALARAASATPETTEAPGCARFEAAPRLIDGRLLISVSISTLAHAARHSDYFFRCQEDGCPLQITDEAAFAKSVVEALNCEQEDGSTPITRMLDAATEYVSEQGLEGIEEGSAA